MKLLVEGKKIESANVITLNHFTFGNPVKSAEATSLPVRLAVALLKDIDGRIVIDVPVQGSTDDPNFRIGRVVLRVIVNLLTKAALSPFAFLGSVFGGGKELAYQEFAPGSSELQESEIKKLQSLVQALTNRPGLSLDLAGSYDVAADTHALKRVKLAERVRRTVWETKRLVEPGIAPPPPAPPESFIKRALKAITSSKQKPAPDPLSEENARRVSQHAQAVAAAVAAGLPLEEMTGRLAETMTVDESDLRALGQARAQRVRDYFAGVGKISPDRLFLTKDQHDSEKQGKGPRVFLQLQ